MVQNGGPRGYLKSLMTDPVFVDRQFDIVFAKTNIFSGWIQMLLGLGFAFYFVEFFVARFSQTASLWGRLVYGSCMAASAVETLVFFVGLVWVALVFAMMLVSRQKTWPRKWAVLVFCIYFVATLFVGLYSVVENIASQYRSNEHLAPTLDNGLPRSVPSSRAKS